MRILFQKWKSLFRWSWLVAFTLGIIFSIGFTRWKSSASKDKSQSPNESLNRPAPVSAYTVIGKDIVRRFVTHGYLRPVKEVVLRPGPGSTVRDVLVSVGDHVERGQILAHLDSDYQQLKGRLDRIDQQMRNLDYGVTMALAKKQFLSANEVKQKQLEHEAAQIRMQLNDLENNSAVKAPIDGVVGEVSMHSGDYIDGQSNYAIHIVDVSSQRIQLYAPQSVALHLVKGAHAQLVRQQYDEQGHMTEQVAPASLEGIAPIVDPKTGSVQIELSAAKVPENWVSGMYVQIEIVTEEAKNAVSVPNASLVFENGKPFVFKISTPELREPASTPEGETPASKVEKVAVVLGIKDSTLTEIKSGIEEFDQVVSEGQGRLADGATVEIIQ